MVSCSACLKWQHIVCHDIANQRAGVPKRDWDSVDFVCRSCRTKANVGYRPIEPESNLLYGPKESTRLISHTNPMIAHGQPAPMPGPMYKLPTTVHDSVRDAPLSLPPLIQPSNVIGTQNMVVPPLESTAPAVRHRNVLNSADLILVFYRILSMTKQDGMFPLQVEYRTIKQHQIG